jgi:hypothetical protein
LNRSFALLILCALPLLQCGAEASPAAAREADGVFERYEAALNRHDTDAVARFWALDPGTEEQTLARWRGEREFEAATDAVFQISARALGDNAFEITQREDCDFYRELGTGTKTSTFVVHLRDGRFHDVQRGSTTDALGNYAELKARFTAWIQENEPARAATVIRDGHLDFSGATAGEIMDLLREWSGRSGQ